MLLISLHHMFDLCLISFELVDYLLLLLNFQFSSLKFVGGAITFHSFFAPHFSWAWWCEYRDRTKIWIFGNRRCLQFIIYYSLYLMSPSLHVKSRTIPRDDGVFCNCIGECTTWVACAILRDDGVLCNCIDECTTWVAWLNGFLFRILGGACPTC